MHRALPAVAFAVVCVGACERADEVGPDAAVDAAIDAPRPPAGDSRGPFQLTYYWMTFEDDYPGTASETLYGPGCRALATVTPTFARNVRLEGTGRLHDGRVINVTGSCGCSSSPCFAEVDAQHPWGIGVQDRALVPYRSVAVDRAVVPYGTWLWIADLDGVTVPGDAPWGGFVHDGCVQAVDTGGAIDGAHLDWFVGLRSSYRSLDADLDLSQVLAFDGGARCGD